MASPQLTADLSQPSPSVLQPSSGSPLTNFYNRFVSWRRSLELPNPGSVENLQKEVKSKGSSQYIYRCISNHSTDTHLTNFFFDGGRADLSKSLSVNPIFQVALSFALGSQTALPSYNFGAVFANNNVRASARCCHMLFRLFSRRSSCKVALTMKGA